MSLEITLERIAVALEAIAKAKSGNPLPVLAPVKDKKAKPAPEVQNAPAEQQAAPESDPFAQESGGQPSTITLGELTDLLRSHAKKLGNPVTIALVKKHGADPVMPKITGIPEGNYQACYDEAMKDLKKAEKK